jgi:hypothetical protein
MEADLGPLPSLSRDPGSGPSYVSSPRADRPIDDICLDDLHFKHNFTQSAAETFLRVYDATISYAGLSDSDSIHDDEDDFEADLAPPEIEVGDMVQVEVNGQLVTAKPVRVRAVQEHNGDKWFYVEGSESGVSMQNLELVEKGSKASGYTPPPLPLAQVEDQRTDRSAKSGWKEERLIDDAGDETFLSYKGEPSVERYEFIRDYLDFRIQRLKPKAAKNGLPDVL